MNTAGRVNPGGVSTAAASKSQAGITNVHHDAFLLALARIAARQLAHQSQQAGSAADLPAGETTRENE
jgi:hypothetical protein